jgi:glycosyltransferase involved in cell wall biosynthesis
VHNAYRQRGGEDEVVESEVAMLRGHGHDVRLFTASNAGISERGAPAAALKSVWNHWVYRDMLALLRAWPADVVHLHNTFPILSSAAHRAARTAGAAVVQTLHNYRLLCVNGLLFRRGRPCEACVGRALPWPGALRGCYRDSRLASAAAVVAVAAARALGVTGRAVDRFVVGSRFAAEKLVAGGLPREKVAVRANFLHPDPGPGGGAGGYALFVGRLVPEKGVRPLLDAWRRLGERLPLRVVGGGPLADEVERAARDIPGVSRLGELPRDAVAEQMGEAAFLVMPSLWYETFGRVGMEAMARGTPIAAARIGAVAELVDEGRTGVTFAPGDVDGLVAAVERLLADPGALVAMRGASRLRFEERHTAARHYPELIGVYERAAAEAERRRG